MTTYNVFIAGQQVSAVRAWSAKIAQKRARALYGALAKISEA